MAAKVSSRAFLRWAAPHARRMENALKACPGLRQINPLKQWGYVLGRRFMSVITFGKWKGRPVGDCNGLPEGFVQLMTGKNVDTKSRYNYLIWCEGFHSEDMSKMPQRPNVAVFRHDPAAGYIVHVGFLWRKFGPGPRDWLVLEAANSDKGTIISKFHSQWNRWGEMRLLFDYDVPAIPQTVELGDTGETVKLLQAALTAAGYHPDADGVFDYALDKLVRRYQGVNGLEADGEVGPITWSWLLT